MKDPFLSFSRESVINSVTSCVNKHQFDSKRVQECQIVDKGSKIWMGHNTIAQINYEGFPSMGFDVGRSMPKLVNIVLGISHFFRHGDA